jgi:hypothetical protein
VNYKFITLISALSHMNQFKIKKVVHYRGMFTTRKHIKKVVHHRRTLREGVSLGFDGDKVIVSKRKHFGNGFCR